MGLSLRLWENHCFTGLFHCFTIKHGISPYNQGSFIMEYMEFMEYSDQKAHVIKGTLAHYSENTVNEMQCIVPISPG